MSGGNTVVLIGALCLLLGAMLGRNSRRHGSSAAAPQPAQTKPALSLPNEDLERRVAQRTAELSAANRGLEAFAYSVAHDLQAPLRSVDGFSRLLLEEHSQQLDPHAIEYLTRMRNATWRMQQLIDDLLSLSRATHSELKPVPTDLSAIARSIAAQLQAEAPGRNAEFRIERGVVGLGDPNLLRIALNNLLGNAWKFSANRERALIEFGALLERVKTVYYVRDNGVGFDMKYAGKLFGAFQRAHSARDFEGTGIGLATVSRIIDRHGGSVWTEAEVDKGATIYFTLAGTGGHQC